MCATPTANEKRTRRSGSGSPAPTAWQEIDWREHQRWVIVDGAPVNTIEIGPQSAHAGEPLVFVHGLSGSWPNWLEQLPAFSREHRVIALDLPGFGHSPMPLRSCRSPATRSCSIACSGSCRSRPLR